MFPACRPSRTVVWDQSGPSGRDQRGAALVGDLPPGSQPGIVCNQTDLAFADRSTLVRRTSRCSFSSAVLADLLHLVPLRHHRATSRLPALACRLRRSRPSPPTRPVPREQKPARSGVDRSAERTWFLARLRRRTPQVRRQSARPHVAAGVRRARRGRTPVRSSRSTSSASSLMTAAATRASWCSAEHVLQFFQSAYQRIGVRAGG